MHCAKMVDFVLIDLHASENWKSYGKTHLSIPPVRKQITKSYIEDSLGQ